MTHQYQGPQQPHNHQPYQGQTVPGGYPHGPAPYQPRPPKKGLSNWAITGICVGSVFGVLILFGLLLGGGDSDTGTATRKADTVAAAPKDTTDDKPADAAPAKEAEPKTQSQADQFKAYIQTNGTPAEKAAVAHVTKVQGADKENGYLDTAQVWTDFTGGLLGPHSGEGKILASAFADWRQSKNGLVSIYGEDGKLISNGNY